MKIWQRYIATEVLKVFFLLLCSLYVLYSMIDYTLHIGQIVQKTHIPFLTLIKYYGILFSKRCGLLLPLAMLIATLKVLCSLNKSNELLAFQATGIPLYRLTRPIFFLGLFCVCLNYLNLQFLTPHTTIFINQFEKKYFKNTRKTAKTKSPIQTKHLEDGSQLIYQYYDENEKLLFDVFYILSANEIWHMKTLSVDSDQPTGYFVDCFKRNHLKELEKTTSFKTFTFKSFDLKDVSTDIVANHLEFHSITDLLKCALNPSVFNTENPSAIQTQLYYKLLSPWLAIYAILGACPFCVSFNRSTPTFLIFSLSIFGFIAFFTLLECSLILGESQVIPPFWAVFSFPILALIVFGRYFIKKTC